MVYNHDNSIARDVRLLHAGINRTAQGEVLFDSQAARKVIVNAAKGGVDIMIDLEHLSLEQDSLQYNPDALGWGELRVKKGPELWLTNIKWTSEGLRRLQSKKQRYLSPVIMVDSDGRAESIFNVALTALPATFYASPLIAASRLGGKSTMDSELVAALLEASDMQVDPEFLPKTAALLGLPEAATVYEVEAAFLEVIAKLKKAEEIVSEPEGQEEATASEEMAVVASLLGVKNGKEAIRKLRTMESEERTKLVASLVRARVETPASAYESGKLCKRLQIESLDSMRLRLAAAVAVQVRAPVGRKIADKLTDKEKELCKRFGANPERFAELKERANG